ncbi:MAG TPA: class I SAM-dependent methyltransferase [Pirellulales bacterium]|nr:class I SAM-dependent methyltransferase [Pirellulales bacterium]
MAKCGEAACAKLRGGYYTPPEVAAWLAQWAIRSADDRVLEPSSGDGVFLEQAAKRLLRLGASPDAVLKQIAGVEIEPAEARKAAVRMEGILGREPNGQVARADFFHWLTGHSQEQFDCALGNPPFIRYQNFPEPSRSRAMSLMKSFGLRPNKLTNTWVPFVVGSLARLKRGGRLAMVLPAELLQVSYAAQLRRFLANHFTRIHIFACNRLFFDNAEQEVLLLLADGYSPAAASQCLIELIEADDVDGVLSSTPNHRDASEYSVLDHGSEKWLKYFLKPVEIGFMRALKTHQGITHLAEHAEIDIGVVTGRNEFFVVPKSTLEEFNLREFAVNLVGRSSQLRGAIIGDEEWREMAEGGKHVHLLLLGGPRSAALNEGAKRYIATGENRGVHTGYKCALRAPWYLVPSIWVPDAFFFRQIYDFPRVVLNKAGAISTDTIHRMRCRKKPVAVLQSLYTHLTAASAEIEGRSYGGGVLELQPTEAERLLMPKKLGDGLPLPTVDQMIRKGNLPDILAENDRLILRELGLTKGECAMLKAIWEKMRERRRSRKR